MTKTNRVAACTLAIFVAWSSPAPAQPAAEPVTINFEGVELATFVKFISKLTGRNFVFTEKVGGTVTVVSPTPVTVEEAYTVFESVLAVRGLSALDDGVAIRIVPSREARTSGTTVLTGDDTVGGFGTRLIPLQHVSVGDVAAVFEPLVSKDGSVVAYEPTNTLIVTDDPGGVQRVGAIVAALDIPGNEEAVELITLRHADVDRVAEQVVEILGSGGGKPGKDRGAGSLPFKIVPDQRTNGLIVMAPKMDMRRIRDLARSLDTPPQADDARIHVYYARHADAEALVSVLTGMDQNRRRAPTARGETRAATAITGDEDTRITSDPATNAVIVHASAQKYRNLRTLIEKLDIPRPQVFIQAILVEASLDGAQALGFDFQVGGDIGDGVGLVRTNLANLNGAFLNPASLSGLVLAATSDKVVELPDGTEVPASVALFQALETSTDVEVLSAPTLLTLDNQEAEILVGQNVPFITGQGVDISAIDNVFTTVERHDVGIKLRVKPQVSEGDIVLLEIEEEVSSLVENNLLDAAIANIGPTTTIRSASTTVTVRDGHTVVIGGLISNVSQRGVSKVPFLGDMPWLGRLFRHERESSRKVNLIAFLTPHIIRSSEQLARLSQTSKAEFRDATGDPTRELPGDAPPPVAAPVAPPTPRAAEPVEAVAPKSTRSQQRGPEQIFHNWPIKRQRPPGSG